MPMDSSPLSRETLAELAIPSGARFALTAALDWLVIALVFALAAWVDHPLGYALAILPLGSRQQALGALFHDAAHGVAARRSWLNEFLGGALAAWPLGLTLGGYRRYHLAHHQHLGSTADPEMRHKGALRHWRLPASPLRVALGFGGDFVLGGIPHLAYATHMTRPVRTWEVVMLGVFWAAVLAVFYLIGALWIPALFVFSIATVFWSGVRLRIWTEHTGTRGTHRITMPGLFAHVIMPHNIGLHWEHHLYPTVPFFNLGKLREAIDRTGVATAVVPLHQLVAAFFRAKAVQSGALGSSIDDAAFAEESELRRSRREVRALRGVVHVGLPIGVGILIYLTMRDELPRTLEWFSSEGGRLVGVFPRWVEQNLPDAVWAYALMSAVLIVWDEDRRTGLRWALGVLVVVVIAELAQAPGWVPGTFDLRDVVFSVAAGILAVVLCPRGATWPCSPERTHD